MKEHLRIPFVNLDRQYDEIREEIAPAIEKVLESKAYILGPFVEDFERDFSDFIGVKHAIGCSSGTSAISLLLEALELGVGDEVITVGHTFAATAGAIRHIGCVPVFVDIEQKSYLMNPSEIQKAITTRTRAIMPVHLYGTPCDMGAIMDIASRSNLFVIEDAAQAHGAKFHGAAAGSLGTGGTFSFYPGKNLGAFGDAGAITTNDDALATRIRKLRDHGRMSKYMHDVVGYNHRMDGIQGAVLSVKLRHLTEWNRRRHATALRYDSALVDRGFKVIEVPQGVLSAHHLYVVEVSNRAEVQEALSKCGVATGVHYPVPLQNQPAFSRWKTESLPVTEHTASRILSLPICGAITEDEQSFVIDAFLKVAKQ